MTKAFEVVYLNPGRVTFERKGDTLSLTLETEDTSSDAPDGMTEGTLPNIIRYPRVALRACFPVSDNTEFLSVRDATDETIPELGVIEDWSQLQPESRDAVAAELGLHYFVPEITQVFNIREELGFLYWTVETDKGRKEFVMRNSVIHYAREILPGHWLLIDVNEARYEIPDVAALDAHSQKLVQRFLYL
jgi:hypothetical protein